MEQKNSQNIKTKHGSLTKSRQRLFGPLWWWAVIKISSSSLLWDMSISLQDRMLQSVRGIWGDLQREQNVWFLVPPTVLQWSRPMIPWARWTPGPPADPTVVRLI